MCLLACIAIKKTALSYAAVSSSRAILPSSQKPPESIRGRDPSAVMCEFL